MAEGQFFDKLFSGAHGKAAEQEALYQKQRDEDTAMYMTVLHDPAASREQRQRAADAIGKLRNLKKGENPYHGISDFLSNLSEHIQKRDSSTAPQPQSLPQVQGPTSTSTGSAPGNRPNGLPPLTAEGPRVGLGRKMLGAAAKGLGGVMRGVENVSASMAGFNSQTPKPSDLPPIDVQAFPEASQYLGKKVDSFADVEGNRIAVYQRPDGSQYQVNEGKQRGYQRPVQQGAVSIADAKKQADSGQKFVGEDGQPIDLSKLPADMKLLRIRQQDKEFYVPVTQNQKISPPIGGKRYGITELGIVDLPDELQSGGATELGPAVVGSTTDTQNRLYGKETTKTPQTPGVTAQPTGPAGAQPIPLSKPGDGTPQPIPADNGQKRGLTPVSGGGGTSAPPKSPGRAGGAARPLPGGPNTPTRKDPASATAHSVTSGGKLGPPIPNMQMQKQANAINEARNSLIGDTPGQLGGIAGDLSIFNNPASVRRLSEYIGFVNSNLDESGKDVTGKGVWAAIDWYGQLPRAVSNLEQEALRKVGQPLTPEEQKFVADYYRLMGTIGGMRAATGASAAKWNFTNLRGELPTPGIVTGYGDAVNRLRNFTHETNVVSQYNPLIQPVDDSLLNGLGSGTTERWVRRNGKLVKELTGGTGATAGR